MQRITRAPEPMLASSHVSETPAMQWLRKHKVPFSLHVYDYVEHGGTAESARQLGMEEHRIIKTLVMQDETTKPLVVLMHGDRKVSTKRLARQIGCKSLAACLPEVAQRHSGYQVGGTSPFALRKPMPIYVEASVLGLPQMLVNAGRRGVLLAIDPAVLIVHLKALPVECALAPADR